ncbi:MAG: hypothetical protein ACTS3R_06335 [Inquilinaceae bacterium]
MNRRSIPEPADFGLYRIAQFLTCYDSLFFQGNVALHYIKKAFFPTEWREHHLWRDGSLPPYNFLKDDFARDIGLVRAKLPFPNDRVSPPKTRDQGGTLA